MRWLRSSKALLVDRRGTVFLEFLVVFVPFWTFFLSLVQLALISHANLIVKHAADAAARSAVVVLPDDPNEYGGEPSMTVERGRVTVGDIASALASISSALRDPSAQSVVGAFSERTFANLGRSRLNTIRLAAHVPLIPLAPVNVGYDSRPSIRKSIGGPRKLLSSLYYQPLAVAVTFPGLVGTEVTEPEITVRVTYAYQCTVPIARNLLCTGFGGLGSMDDFDQAFFPFAQSFVGGRFKRLQHETTLLIHDAPYEYKPRGS
jgi:hypothetical protein